MSSKFLSGKKKEKEAPQPKPAAAPPSPAQGGTAQGVTEYGLTENEVKEYKAAFTLLDKNRDGRVNMSELKSMMEGLGMQVTDEYVEEIIRKATPSGEGLISEEEFLHFMGRSSQSQGEPSEDLVAAFRVFDRDRNGYITRDELRQGMELIGEKVSEDAIDEMLRVADIDKDGKINYEEFARMLL